MVSMAALACATACALCRCSEGARLVATERLLDQELAITTLLNPEFAYSSVHTSTVAGQFVLTGFVDGATPPAQGWPVVLVYHGGA